MPNGGPITVKTGKENNRVFFAVKDEGQGIPEKIKDRIFEPFFTTKEKGDGTGLGLSICKRLVEANGGTITFFSEEGKGTTFFVHFPIGQKGNSIPS
jgi:signal transduction histidine kinase